MTDTRRILRILAVALLLNLNAVVLAFGSDSPMPKAVATVDTTNLLPNLRDLTFTTVAFSSETTIEVIACTTPIRDASCPASVFRWENGTLRHVPERPMFAGGSTSSADGKRVLVNFNDRNVSKPQHVLDDMRAVWSLGMIYPEEVNREVVQVVDTTTRRSCFDLQRTFPMTISRRKSAAISPSGEFIAIKVENVLSLYRIPSVCKGAKVSRRADNRR